MGLFFPNGLAIQAVSMGRGLRLRTLAALQRDHDLLVDKDRIESAKFSKAYLESKTRP